MLISMTGTVAVTPDRRFSIPDRLVTCFGMHDGASWSDPSGASGPTLALALPLPAARFRADDRFHLTDGCGARDRVGDEEAPASSVGCQRCTRTPRASGFRSRETALEPRAGTPPRDGRVAEVVRQG
jgi:hypothetical protein